MRKKTDDVVVLSIVRVTLWDHRNYPVEADLLDLRANLVARIRIDKSDEKNPKIVFLTTAPAEFSEESYRKMLATMSTRRPTGVPLCVQSGGAHQHGGTSGPNGGRGGGHGHRHR